MNEIQNKLKAELLTLLQQQVQRAENELARGGYDTGQHARIKRLHELENEVMRLDPNTQGREIFQIYFRNSSQLRQYDFLQELFDNSMPVLPAKSYNELIAEVREHLITQALMNITTHAEEIVQGREQQFEFLLNATDQLAQARDSDFESDSFEILIQYIESVHFTTQEMTGDDLAAFLEDFLDVLDRSTSQTPIA